MAQPAKAVVTEIALASALLATLAAFGITMSAADGINSVGPWVVDRFEDFVNTLGESVDVVVDKIRYGVDKAGNFIGNSYALSYNARFAQWLQSEYSLSDNSSVSVSIPRLPLVDSASTSNIIAGNFISHRTVASNNDVGSFYNAVISSSDVICVCWESSTEPGGIGGLIYASLDRFTYYWAASWASGVTQGPFTQSYSNADPFGYFYYMTVFDPSGDLDFVDSSCSSILFPTYEAAYRAVFDLLGATPFTITTGVIDIPQVGDYSGEDGFILDGLGSWGDTLQDIWNKVNGLTFPDSVWPTVDLGIELSSALVDALVSSGVITTENSPGFFNGLPLISGIPDFSFGDLWHYVTDWVGSMSAGLSLIGGIMFSLPFVAAFYALVVILIVLSLWRLLRSA